MGLNQEIKLITALGVLPTGCKETVQCRCWVSNDIRWLSLFTRSARKGVSHGDVWVSGYGQGERWGRKRRERGQGSGCVGPS